MGRVRTRWIMACALGEAAGIALVATVYAALDRNLLSAAAVWILAAGAWEGLCLGSAQAWILRRRGVAPVTWVALTVLAAVIGYGLSLLGGAGSGGEGPGAPGPALVAALGAALGVVMGAMMGAIQSLAAGRVLSAKRWIAANMAGWAPAMAIIMLAATSVEASLPLGLITLAGAVSGGIAGMALGLVTGLFLPARITRR